MLSLQMFKSPCLVANGLKVFWTLHKTPSLSSTLGTQPTKTQESIHTIITCIKKVAWFNNHLHLHNYVSIKLNNYSLVGKCNPYGDNPESNSWKCQNLFIEDISCSTCWGEANQRTLYLFGPSVIYLPLLTFIIINNILKEFKIWYCTVVVTLKLIWCNIWNEIF